MAITPVQQPQPTPAIESVEQRFRRLEAEWSAATRFLSDPAKIMGHPAMREIVALGDEVVPIILRDLLARVSLMVWVLPEITGENLTPPTVEGGFRKWDVGAQVEAWLEWGREKGFV